MSNERVVRRFGAAVTRERERRGLTQEDLAFAAGLDRTYTSAIERGRRNVGLLNIHRLAKALRVKAGDLV